MAKIDQGGGNLAPGLARLPPGRHGLSREFVTKNQRDRLTAGMIATVAERGYHDATITQIAAAAGVSRRTFYGYFSSKEECFFDTFGQIEDHLAAAMGGAGEDQAEWAESVRGQLLALLEAFAANPDLVRFCLIAPQEAGGEVADRYRKLLQRLFAILTEGTPQLPEARKPSAAVEDGLVGGIAALIVRRAKAGEGEALAELLPDLLELVLSPYLGREAAIHTSRNPS